MRMHDKIENSLLAQKSQIESRGRLIGKELELNLGTFIVKKNNKFYSKGDFSLNDPDELTLRDANEIAFKTGGTAFKAESYWGPKYKSVCQALSSLHS